MSQVEFKKCPISLGSMSHVDFRGNLAHEFMDPNFLCFSFHLNISNRSKTKNLKILGNSLLRRMEFLQDTDGRYSNLEILLNLDFTNDSPCDVITLGNSLLRRM